MTTLLYTHRLCGEHDPGSTHPECPDRLKAVMMALDGEAFGALERREAPKGDIADIERVHAPAYVRHVFDSVPKTGYVYLDADTVISPLSAAAAMRAVGGVCAAVDAVAAGEAKNAFCAVRPPGHHAEHNRAMGFCLFNNIAIAALHARHACGLQRLAVVDFDVHHGNGTQHCLEADGDLFFASSHQFPCYPGSGSKHECGVGNIINAPLAPGSGSEEFRDVYTRLILPALHDFGPDIVLISAGFDAHAADPLAQLMLTEDDYAWVTRKIVSVAQSCCQGRVISTLEGGYNLAALAASAAAHVSALIS